MAEASENGHAPQALVVEDDPAVGLAILRLLRKRGYEVKLVASRAHAMEQTGNFDCAVVDLELPDGNGVDIAERMIARDQTRVVVFFTGGHNAALVARAGAYGPIVTKGADLHELERTLAEQLGRVR
ncbi:MAG: response regulator [Polyangiaceae bacterium]